MARFSAVVLAYFVIGATMWGGGAIQWDNSGVGGLIVKSTDGGVTVNENTSQDLEQAGGPIQESAKSLGGPILAIWNFVIKFIGFLFWPITTLASNNAPPQVTVLGGGSLSVMFIGATIRLIRRSA